MEMHERRMGYLHLPITICSCSIHRAIFIVGHPLELEPNDSDGVVVAPRIGYVNAAGKKC